MCLIETESVCSCLCTYEWSMFVTVCCMDARTSYLSWISCMYIQSHVCVSEVNRFYACRLWLTLFWKHVCAFDSWISCVFQCMICRVSMCRLFVFQCIEIYKTLDLLGGCLLWFCNKIYFSIIEGNGELRTCQEARGSDLCRIPRWGGDMRCSSHDGPSGRWIGRIDLHC